MDLGNIIYIIAVLGYFIYQATKNKKPLSKREDEDLPAEPEQRPVSFEDLLKEIREAQRPQPVEKPKNTPYSQPTSSPKPTSTPVIPQVVTEEREQWRPDPVIKKRFSTTRRLERMEQGEIENYRGEFEEVKSELSTTSAGIPDIPSLKSREEVFTRKKQGNRYQKMLKNPQSIKDAIIFKEILDRKYF